MADQKALMMKMGIEGSNKVQRELKQTGAAAKKMGRGLNAAKASAKRLAASLSPAVLGLSAVTAGLAGVAVAAKVYKDAFVGTVKSTVRLADELDTITKKAQSIGATNTDIQLVSNAMALFGVETDKTIKSTQNTMLMDQ